MPKRKAPPQRMTDSLLNKRARQAVGQAKFKKEQVTAIRNIARSVALKAAETKSKLSSLNGSMTDAVVYARNICFNLAQGTTSETYLGEKIYIKNFHFKGQIAFDGTKTDRGKNYRLMVIKSDTNYTTSSSYGTVMTYSDIFRTSSNSALPCHALHADLHKVRVLYDVSGTLDKTFATYSNVVGFDFNIPIHKVETFTGDNNGTFRDGQYFFVFMVDDLNGVITSTASIGYDYSINFKDE